jgi:transcriptional regulatory protein LEU3
LAHKGRIQLLRPKLLPLLDGTQRASIVSLVKSLIDILGSDDVVLDGRHSPALYSRFLHNLLAKYCSPASQEEMLSTEPSQEPDDGNQTPTPTYSWPDVPSEQGTPVPDKRVGIAAAQPVVREHAGDAEMDFSIAHFLQSTMPPASTVYEQPAYQWQMHAPAPTAMPYGSCSFPFAVDPVQQWNHPFNYAAILDRAYTQFDFQGR